MYTSRNLTIRAYFLFAFYLIIPSSVLVANVYNVTTTSDFPISGAGISVNGATGVITGGTGNGQVTVRSAVAAANTIPAGPHTINIPAGTYNLTIAGTGETIFPAAIDKGDLDVTANNVTIDGAGMNLTIINQTSGIDRVFDVNVNFIGDFNFTLTDLTISGGREQTGNGGGGIFTGSSNNLGTVTITNVKFDNNQAFQAMGFMGSGLGGGGLQHQGGHLALSGCVFNNNSTTKSGGALSAFGYQDLPIVMQVNNTMSVTNCTFTNNTCNGASGGGAIDFFAINSTSSTVTVTGCNFTNNVSTASSGGAIVNESANVTITESTFLNNQAIAGGALYAGGGSTSASFCRIIGNNANTGKQVGAAGASVSMTANNNWWGVNTGPGVNDAVASGGAVIIVTKWLQLRHTASPASVVVSPPGSTTLTASFLTNSANEAIAAADLGTIIGLPITFNNAIKGSLSAAQTAIQPTGTATATYTVFMTSCPPSGSADATVDNQTTTATITIIDNLPPTPVCNNITANLLSSSYSFPPADSAAIIAGTVEHCGLTTTFNPPTLNCMNVGPNIITVTYTDDAGNTSSCTATVTLVDVVPPLALCKNVTANLDANGMGSTTAAAVDNGSSDACGIASLMLSMTNFTCANLGANTVTLTVTDNNSNTATCTANVQVVDNIFPTITCPGNQTANAGPSCQTMLPDYTGLVTSSDNCSHSVVQSPAPGTIISGHGTVQVITMTATDIAGNSATCTFNYTVQDITPPTASCMDIMVQLNSMGMATITPASVNNGSSDNCGIMGMQVSQTSFTCSDVGPNEVTLTVTDVAGLSSSCTAIVTVEDPPPMAICQNITVDLDANGMGSTTAMAVDNGSSDACGIQSIVLSQTSFDCDDLGANTVTLTVTDNNSNSATCTATVTVADMIMPTVSCPGDQTEYVNANCQVSLPDYTSLATPSDNCMVSMVSQSPAPGTILSGHNTMQVVTITATDQSGNTGTCTFKVTVLDTISPTASCMDITIQLDNMGMASIVADDIDNGSSDNCGIPGLQVSQTMFTCDDFGDNEIILTVTDGAGNSSTCTANVHVEDPFFVCRSISVDDFAASEGNDGTTIFSVSVSLTIPAGPGGVTFDIATQDNSAMTGNNDYVEKSLTGQTIDEGNSTYEFAVTVNGDNIVEDNETFFVNITNVVGAGVSDPQGVVTINNDDAASLTLSGGSTQNEGDAGTVSYIFTATLNNDVQGGFQVAYTTNNGTATTADNDYQDNDGTLTFAGTTNESMDITVLVNGDTKVEMDETFTVALGAISSTSAVQAAAITKLDSPQSGTITNDDAATVSLLADISSAEAITPQTFSVTLSNPVDVDVTVEFSTGDGTATTGDNDYTGIADEVVTFLAGTTTSQAVNVTINDDNKVEADEVYDASIGTLNASGRNVSLGTTARTGTIENDDSAVVTLSGSPMLDEGNTGTTAFIFTATLDNPVQGGFTAHYTTNDGTATTGDSDYTDNDASIAFTGTLGESHMITVLVTGDLNIEDDETFQVAIDSLSGVVTPAAVTISGSPQTGTILNDELDWGDAPDSYSTLLASNGARHSAAPGSLHLGSTIDGDLDGQPNATATGDGADEDGVTLPGAIVINTTADVTVNASGIGKLDAWVDFNLDGDWDDTGEKIFDNLAVVAGDNNLSFGVPAGATLGNTFARFRISSDGGLLFTGLAADGEVEDYAVDIVNMQFSIDDPAVAEGDAGTANLVFTISRSNNANDCSVDYAITGGTATVADLDYQALAAGTAMFTTGGALTQTVTVLVNGDEKVELDETVEITLSMPVDASILDGSGTGTIMNDDTAVITITSPSIDEGCTGTQNLVFDIAMSHTSDANVSFDFGTSDGTATTADMDYTMTSGSHTLTPGQTTKQVSVPIIGDCDIEPDEMFSVILSSLDPLGRDIMFNGGNATLTGTGTIENDDAPPVFTCPGDLVIECAEGTDYAALIEAWTGTASVTAACGNPAVEDDYDGVSIPDVSCAGQAFLTVTFTATDDCENSATCSRKVTIVDTTPPVINITDEVIMIGCEDDPASAMDGYTVTDACSDVTVNTGIDAGFCNTEAVDISAGNANAYSASNWYKIEVGGLNDAVLDAADVLSLNLTFLVNESGGTAGGKGRIEFWLVNPCNEAIRLTGPVCSDDPMLSSDDGCSQGGLFSPVFKFTDPCIPKWENNLILDNTGMQEEFAPYAGTSGQVMLGNLAITAVESVDEFTCGMITGDWYVFGRKQIAQSSSIKIQQACLSTCPQAYTKTITATDNCNLVSKEVQYLVREEECTECGVNVIWYVDTDATGTNNGLTWTDAFTDLQDALSAAHPGDQIWVAEGIYTPGTSRLSTFSPGSGVSMYGGFEGGETEVVQRDIVMHPTILSGEIGGAEITDNCYHIVTIPGCVYDAQVNGFIIERGYANAFLFSIDRGAGVLCSGDLDLISCEIRDCHSTNAGSAIYNSGENAMLLIEDCMLGNNGLLSTTSVLNTNSGNMTVKNSNVIQE